MYFQTSSYSVGAGSVASGALRSATAAANAGFGQHREGTYLGERGRSPEGHLGALDYTIFVSTTTEEVLVGIIIGRLRTSII